MIVGVCLVELVLPGARSLKDKRMVLRGLKDRVAKKYNASIAETDHMDLLQRSQLGIALVSNDRGFLESVIQKIENEFESIVGGNLVAFEKKFIG